MLVGIRVIVRLIFSWLEMESICASSSDVVMIEELKKMTVTELVEKICKFY